VQTERGAECVQSEFNAPNERSEVLGGSERSPWAQGGSKRYLWTEGQLVNAIAYVHDDQVEPLD